MMTSIWAGLTVGAIYAIVAIGYNITLTTANILNFAYANVLVIGGFIAYSATLAGLPLPAVLALSVLGGIVIAVLIERLALRWMPRGSHAELVTTVGAATVLTGVTAIVWGPDALRVVLFEQSPVSVLGGQILPSNLIMIILVVAIAAALGAITRFTRIGLAARTFAADPEASMLRGVNVRWLAIGAFVIAGAIAGLVGPFVAVAISASPLVGLVLAVKGFIVLTLGGIGSQVGALIGGLVIGLAEAFTQLAFGVLYGDFVVFLLFIVVLFVRPSGLFGRRTGRLV